MGLWGKGKESGRSGQTSVAIAAPATQGAEGPGCGLRNWRCPEAAARGADWRCPQAGLAMLRKLNLLFYFYFLFFLVCVRFIGWFGFGFAVGFVSNSLRAGNHL